jgi:hypothetical protein
MPTLRRLNLPIAILLAVALLVSLLLVGLLGRGRPAARFQPSDRNVMAGETAEWTFDGDAAGGLPPGVEVFSGEWAVRPEGAAPSPPNVLCQTGASDFPALSLCDKIYADLTMSARFKPVSGKVDQAAGLLFRVQDRDNYYILRANALEDNVNFYIYASGKRTSLRGGAVKVPAGQWHELRVEVTDNRFRGFLNGQQVVEASDDSYTAGKVGLWTKADSTTCFDDIRVTAQ